MNKKVDMHQTDNMVNEKTSTRQEIKKNLKKLLWLVLPLLLLLLAVGTAFLPKVDPPKHGTTMKMLSVEGFPATLVLEQNDGMVKSAWLRTPAGVREINNIEGLTYLSESTYITKATQGNRDDLLWRTSYINFESEKGVHLWIGISPGTYRAFIVTTPYNYTKWDSIPAKLVVPKGTAVYISPAVPPYDSRETFRGKDSYSFVYTIRMTPDGPAFTPVPDVYRQLTELLRVVIQGEHSVIKRLAYTRMLDEFNRLAAGNLPGMETLLNFQMNKLDTITWRN